MPGSRGRLGLCAVAVACVTLWENIVFSTDWVSFVFIVSSNALLSFMWLVWFYIIYRRLKWTKWIKKGSFIACLERNCPRYSQDESFIKLPWNASPAVLFMCCGHWVLIVFSCSVQWDVSCCSSFQPWAASLWKDLHLLPVHSQWPETVSGLLPLWLRCMRPECKSDCKCPKELWGDVCAHFVFSWWWVMMWLELQVPIEIHVVNFCRLLILHLDKFLNQKDMVLICKPIPFRYYVTTYKTAEIFFLFLFAFPFYS